jgi:hypothetical protein
MTFEERGIYIDLLAYCWREGSIPTDPEGLSRLLNTAIETVHRTWPAIAPCFDDHGRNWRLDKERRAMDKRRKAMSDAGILGNERRWGGDRLAIAKDRSASAEGGGAGSDLRDELFLNSHTGQSPNGARPARAMGEFEEFWTVWPWKTNKPAAWKAFVQLGPDRPLLEAMKLGVARYQECDRVKRGVILHASTWIRNRRWEDQPMKVEPPRTRADQEWEREKRRFLGVMGNRTKGEET